MSKMKPMPSRRRRALRSCLIALLAIALYSSVSFYALTPLKAVEYAKDRSGLYDPTEVVSVQWVPEMHRPQVYSPSTFSGTKARYGRSYCDTSKGLLPSSA